MQTKARTYFNSLFNRPDATNVIIAAVYSASGGSSVVVNGSAKVPTNFLGIMGYDSLTVNGLVHVEMGLRTAARGFGAGQHRLDVERRQDDGA